MEVDRYLQRLDPKRREEVIAVLNRLRDSVLDGASQIEDPKQLSRYLDGIAAFAQGIDGMHAANQRPVDRTITKIRDAAQNIGFGKFVTREGRQEQPED